MTTWTRSMAARLVMAGALAALVASAAGADPLPPLPPPTQSWQFEAAPYLWLPAMSGAIAPSAAVQPVQVHLSPWDLLSNLKFGLMGRFEARNDRFVGFSDLVYADTKFSGHIGIRDPNFLSGSVTSKLFLSTNLAGYRAVDDPNLAVDLLAGLRFENVDTGLRLQGPRRVFDRTKSQFWVDPLLGARVKAKLARKWDATVWGDFGGFGAGSKFTGEVEGALAYRFARSWRAFAGWRYLYTDYDHGGFVFNTDLNGPVLGATYRF